MATNSEARDSEAAGTTEAAAAEPAISPMDAPVAAVAKGEPGAGEASAAAKSAAENANGAAVAPIASPDTAPAAEAAAKATHDGAPEQISAKKPQTAPSPASPAAPASPTAPAAATIEVSASPSSATMDERIQNLSEEHGLTARETEIFALLARGRNAQFIMNHFVISRNTVKSHVRHIYTKLDVHSQQELINLVEGVEELPEELAPRKKAA